METTNKKGLKKLLEKYAYAIKDFEDGTSYFHGYWIYTNDNYTTYESDDCHTLHCDTLQELEKDCKKYLSRK